jgi:predicted methyltransferase
MIRAARLLILWLLLPCTVGQAGPTDGLASMPMDAQTRQALEQLLHGPHRSAAHQARDLDRHPIETLSFFGLRRDMTVMEVWPGADGWYTELLGPVLKARGRYIAALWSPRSDSAYERAGLERFQTKLKSRPDLYGKVVVTALEYPDALHPIRPGTVDLVVSFRNLHNWLATEEAALAMLQGMYDALKPGGMLGLVDHRADPAAPIDPHARYGYVNEGFAIELIRRVGFELVDQSEVNANPRDSKDYDQGVWTLPPTYRLGDKDRARYADIGESDRFTLKFRKPLKR